MKNKSVLGSTTETCAVHEVSNKDVLSSTEKAHTVNKVSNKDNLGSAEDTHTVHEVKNKTDLGSSEKTGTVHEVNSKNSQQNMPPSGLSALICTTTCLYVTKQFVVLCWHFKLTCPFTRLTM